MTDRNEKTKENAEDIISINLDEMKKSVPNQRERRWTNELNLIRLRIRFRMELKLDVS